jgi:hypothetical protein
MIGPLFLILAPLALWILLSLQDGQRGRSLQAIGLFSAVSFAAWTFGVISSQSLWQARLLFPALLPFAIPAALSWDSLKRLDSSKFRVSFFANMLIAAVIALTLFDNGMFVLQRNPFAVAFGAQSREQYIARVNPSYAALIQVMEKLPANAYLYNLFEPRSYGLPRRTRSTITFRMICIFIKQPPISFSSGGQKAILISSFTSEAWPLVQTILPIS